MKRNRPKYYKEVMAFMALDNNKKVWLNFEYEIDDNTSSEVVSDIDQRGFYWWPKPVLEDDPAYLRITVPITFYSQPRRIYKKK